MFGVPRVRPRPRVPRPDDMPCRIPFSSHCNALTPTGEARTQTRSDREIDGVGAFCSKVIAKQKSQGSVSHKDPSILYTKDDSRNGYGAIHK